jgi:hypothetical protein
MTSPVSDQVMAASTACLRELGAALCFTASMSAREDMISFYPTRMEHVVYAPDAASSPAKCGQHDPHSRLTLLVALPRPPQRLLGNPCKYVLIRLLKSSADGGELWTDPPHGDQSSQRESQQHGACQTSLITSTGTFSTTRPCGYCLFVLPCHPTSRDNSSSAMSLLASSYL